MCDVLSLDNDINHDAYHVLYNDITYGSKDG